MCSHIPRWHFKSGYKNGSTVFMLTPQKNQKRSILRAEKYGDLTTAEHDPQRRTCISEQSLIDNKDIILNSRGAFLSMKTWEILSWTPKRRASCLIFARRGEGPHVGDKVLYVRGIRVHWRQGVESAHRRCTEDLWTWWMSSWFQECIWGEGTKTGGSEDVTGRFAEGGVDRRSEKCFPMPPSVFVCLFVGVWFVGVFAGTCPYNVKAISAMRFILIRICSIGGWSEVTSSHRSIQMQPPLHRLAQKRTGRWEHRVASSWSVRATSAKQGWSCTNVPSTLFGSSWSVILGSCSRDATVRSWLERIKVDLHVVESGWCLANRCNWAQYKNSMSNDSEIKVLTKSECCLCLISVARKVTSTPPVNRSSTLQSFGRFTDNTHAMETGHPGAEISHQQVSHFSQCAEEPNKGFALLKVRGSSRHGFALSRILELQIEIDKHEFLAEFTKRARCEVTRRTTPDVKRRSTFSW